MHNKRSSNELDDIKALGEEYAPLLPNDSSQPLSYVPQPERPDGLNADAVAAHYRSLIAANTRTMSGVLGEKDKNFIVGAMMHIIKIRGSDMFCKVLPKLLIGSVGALVGIGALWFLGPLLLGALGFGALGPIAGSLAAAIQAALGNVAAGSLFAACQSISMGGAIPALWTAIAAAIGFGSTTAIAPKREKSRKKD